MVLNLYTGTVNNRIIKFFMILISSVRHIIIRMCFWRYRVQYSRLGGLAGFSACGVEEALIIHKDTCSWCSTNSQLWRSARRGICQGTHTHNSLLLWHNGSSLSSESLSWVMPVVLCSTFKTQQLKKWSYLCCNLKEEIPNFQTLRFDCLLTAIGIKVRDSTEVHFNVY